MAITINQQPKAFTPSDNPIVWTFSSNQTAQPNFVYVVKVYINDSLISNELVFPDNGIYGRYDASNHASNYCNLPTIGSAIVADAANYCKVRITIVERYGATPADAASVVGTNKIAWKAKMFDTDFINWNPTPYTYGSGALWLTNYPDYPSVRLEDESIRLMLINNLNNITLTIYLYDANGDEINNDVIVSGVGSSFLISILELSPANIISLSGLTASDFELSAYYEISIPTSVAPQRINIDKSVVYPTYKRLHAITQWGGIEAVSFGLISRKKGKIESKSYIRGLGNWNGSAFEFTEAQGRNIDYAKTIEREMICVSDWLPESLQNWLIYNIIASPAVFVEETSGLVRRAVKSRTVEEFIKDNDMIFLEEVTVTLPTYNSMIL